MEARHAQIQTAKSAVGHRAHQRPSARPVLQTSAHASPHCRSSQASAWTAPAPCAHQQAPRRTHRRHETAGCAHRPRPWPPSSAPLPQRPMVAAQVASAQQGELELVIRPAEDDAELRAAAYLRAASFYTYPPGRSEWAERSHRRMKADTEWEAVSAKVQGKDEAYKNVRVTAFIATIPDDPMCEVAQQVAASIDASAKLPSQGPGQPPLLVVGTMDLNVGRNLPAEELQGRWPQLDAQDTALRGDPTTQRAYLSNVCVSDGVRRRGVARQLLESVEQYAREQGIVCLYVHVVHDNTPAVNLYRQALGYQIEAEESESFARAAARSKRLLLMKRIAT